MSEDKKLFEEFKPITINEWEDKILKSLKGQKYSEKLIWHTIDGFDVRPYYRKEDLAQLDYLKSNPGRYPYTRGNNETNIWENEQKVKVSNVEKANQQALNYIKNGATSLFFELSQKLSGHKLKRLLNDINSNEIALNFSISDNYNDFENIIQEIFSTNNINRGYLDIDPLAYLMLNGKYPCKFDDAIDTILKILQFLNNKSSNYRGLNVRGQIFHNAGATTVQELAFTLSAATEYLTQLTDKGLDIESITPKIQFSFAIGSNYFLEIAKLRTARILWSTIIDQYNPSDTIYNKVFIHSETSVFNKSIFDPYTNILRTTTEAMSAIIGGTNSLRVHPFDFIYKEPDEFSLRVACNIQNLLKYESYLDKSIDPAAGTYYIENLTDELAKNSWNLFKKIEKEGGFIEATKKGIIQLEIEEISNTRKKRMASGQTNILGTNLYPNPSEKMLDEIQKNITCDNSPKGNIIKPIYSYRKSEPFEELRLKTEKFGKNGGKIPAVFLFPIGNLAKSVTRSIFSRNFFAAGGFSIIDNHTFNSLEQGIKEFINSKADIIVICSSDEEYIKYAPAIAKNLRENNSDAHIVVAGYPKEIIENLQKAGINDFIHLKSNLLETLKKYQKLFKIS